MGTPEENAQKIAEALAENDLILKAAAEGTLSVDVANKIISDLGTSTKVQEFQSQLSHIGLAEDTVKAQQELSDLFGIPTFDVTGKISTIPTSGVISPDIDVGTGILTESAFIKSLDTLIKLETAQSGLGKSLNDIFFKPITDFFDSLFVPVPDEDLTAEELAIIAELERERADLMTNMILPLPPCKQINCRVIWRITAVQHCDTDCTERDAAMRNNAQYQPRITEIDNRLKTIRQDFVATRETTKIIIAKTAQLKDLIEREPLTEILKAEISKKIQEASKIIEEMLRNNIEVARSDLSALQVTMNAAAFRLTTPISEKMIETTSIIDSLIEIFKPVTSLVDDLTAALTAALVTAFLEIAAPSPETIATFARNSVQALILLRKEGIDGIDTEAQRVEAVQKELAGG